MRKALIRLVSVLVIAGLGVVVGVQLVTAQRQADKPRLGDFVSRGRPAPDRRTPPPDRCVEAAVQEILEIRRRRGDLLEGTVLDGSSGPAGGGGGGAGSNAKDADFHEALQEVAAQSGIARPPDTGGSSASDKKTARGSVRGERAGDQQLAASLRTAVRRLERKANELEEDRQFHRADRLRRLADRLRREARAVEGNRVSTVAGVPGAVSGRADDDASGRR